jgi:hypothetical protein
LRKSFNEGKRAGLSPLILRGEILVISRGGTLEKIACYYSPLPSFLIGLDKFFDRAVIGPLHIVGEKAGWQLA